MCDVRRKFSVCGCFAEECLGYGLVVPFPLAGSPFGFAIFRIMKTPTAIAHRPRSGVAHGKCARQMRADEYTRRALSLERPKFYKVVKAVLYLILIENSHSKPHSSHTSFTQNLDLGTYIEICCCRIETYVSWWWVVCRRVPES